MHTDQKISVPDAIKDSWTQIYSDIQAEVKQPIGLEEPFEKRVRSILKKHLGADRIRANDEYRQFFKDALKLAINLHTDKILFRIEGGRARYGESRHSKGRIRTAGEDE